MMLYLIILVLFGGGYSQEAAHGRLPQLVNGSNTISDIISLLKSLPINSSLTDSKNVTSLASRSKILANAEDYLQDATKAINRLVDESIASRVKEAEQEISHWLLRSLEGHVQHTNEVILNGHSTDSKMPEIPKSETPRKTPLVAASSISTGDLVKLQEALSSVRSHHADKMDSQEDDDYDIIKVPKKVHTLLKKKQHEMKVLDAKAKLKLEKEKKEKERKEKEKKEKEKKEKLLKAKKKAKLVQPKPSQKRGNCRPSCHLNCDSTCSEDCCTLLITLKEADRKSAALPSLQGSRPWVQTVAAPPTSAAAAMFDPASRCHPLCSKVCLPSCGPNCCKSGSRPLASVSAGASACPANCPKSCAPACSPDCCKVTEIEIPLDSCPVDCEIECLRGPCPSKCCPNSGRKLLPPPASAVSPPVSSSLAALPQISTVDQQILDDLISSPPMPGRCNDRCPMECYPDCLSSCCSPGYSAAQAPYDMSAPAVAAPQYLSPTDFGLEPNGCPSMCRKSCISSCPAHCCGLYPERLQANPMAQMMENKSPWSTTNVKPVLRDNLPIPVRKMTHICLPSCLKECSTSCQENGCCGSLTRRTVVLAERDSHRAALTESCPKICHDHCGPFCALKGCCDR